MTARHELIGPLLPDEQADAMLRLCERFGSYGTYGEEGIEDGFGEAVSQRHDAALNFVKTGGRFGRKEDVATLVARTNYFREEYAYDQTQVEGIEPFLRFEGFFEAARKIYGRPIVEPNIVYANLLVPGQELALHTDVPEFRGMNRRRDPQWLLVAMHHSGLFERWRMHIATGVAWFGRPRGGEFAFYPDGPLRGPGAHARREAQHGDPARHRLRLPRRRPRDRDGGDAGHLRPGRTARPRWRTTPVAHRGTRARCSLATSWDDLRFSVSWKAYCYADEAERRRVQEHSDDLTRTQVLAGLVADLRERGRLGDILPPDDELALTIIDDVHPFPRCRLPAPLTRPH